MYFQSSFHHLMLTKLSVLHSDIGLRLLGPFTLDHCEIMHCSAIGVYSKEKTEGKFGVISDCLISHCPSAVTMFYCDLVVRNSRVFRCEYGVQAFSCFVLNVHDCIIHDCGQKGVFANNVNLVKIKKSAIYDCTCGIVVDRSTILQIENNWLMYISSCFLEISNVVVGLGKDLHCRALLSCITRFIIICQPLPLSDSEMRDQKSMCSIMKSTHQMFPLRRLLWFLLLCRAGIFTKQNNSYYSSLKPINPEIRDRGLS